MAERRSLLSLFRRGREIPAPWVPPDMPRRKEVAPAVRTGDLLAAETHDPARSKLWVPPASWPQPSLPDRPRLVFAVDATASRAAAWEAAQKLQDRFFAAVPGELDVALAVHGGNKVHTFTPFVADATDLRRRAAKVRCRAGYTRLLDILSRTLNERAGIVVYIGDVFEESPRKALHLANRLKLAGTRVIILREASALDLDDGEVFRSIAEITGGAVLPFDHSSLERLGELLEAVALLAVGGVELVEEKRPVMPAAELLLEHLGKNRIGG